MINFEKIVCFLTQKEIISPLLSRLAIEVFLYPHADFSGTGYGNQYNIVVFVLLVVINLQNYFVEYVFIMNPGSFTDRHTPTRPTMPAARGEESERARERCICIYNK